MVEEDKAPPEAAEGEDGNIVIFPTDCGHPFHAIAATRSD